MGKYIINPNLYKYLKKYEINQTKIIFSLMNDISSQLSENYIKEKMKRYNFIAKHFNLSIETIKKNFLKYKVI